MNRFLYAEANPATFIDPSGHYCEYDTSTHGLKNCTKEQAANANWNADKHDSSHCYPTSQAEANNCTAHGTTTDAFAGQEYAAYEKAAKEKAARSRGGAKHDCDLLDMGCHVHDVASGVGAIWDKTGGAYVHNWQMQGECGPGWQSGSCDHLNSDLGAKVDALVVVVAVSIAACNIAFAACAEAVSKVVGSPDDPPASGQTRQITTEDVSNFGSSSAPKLRVDPPDVGSPGGVSAYTDPGAAGLNGHYWTLPAGTELPDGVNLINDSTAIDPYHRLFPLPPGMGTGDFHDLLNSMPWAYGDKIKR